MAPDRINGAPNETLTHSFAQLAGAVEYTDFSAEGYDSPNECLWIWH